MPGSPAPRWAAGCAPLGVPEKGPRYICMYANFLTKNSDLLGYFSPLPLKCGKAQSTVISPAKLSVGIVSSAEVIIHKSLLTLCSFQPYKESEPGYWGIVRSPQRFPRLRGGGVWRKESHKPPPLFSLRTQELMDLNTNAQKSSVMPETPVI